MFLVKVLFVFNSVNTSDTFQKQILKLEVSFRSTRAVVSCKNGVLKNFRKFTIKHFVSGSLF